MDRLPLIPKNEEDHDVLPLTTEIFQDVFRAQKYPRNVADNYKKYEVDVDFTQSREAGLTTIKVLEGLSTGLNDITEVEKEIMRNHALAVIQKHENVSLYEELKLKRVSLFQKLGDYAVQTYGLIEKNEIYPNVIEQYLNFTYNPSLHTCQPCLPEAEHVVPTVPSKKLKKRKQTEPPTGPLFKLEPNKIIFYNYNLGRTYKEKFKLRNITNVPQYFSYHDFPKDSSFRLKLQTDSAKLAPGMSAEFVVTFQTQIYKDCQEVVLFKTANGVDLKVLVASVRDPPKLTCYILNSLLPWDVVQKPMPGNRYFSDRRQSACNFSIDCGTCLLGSYSLMTVIIKNDGQKGRFFITTENEWIFSELNVESTRALELTQGAFTLFPTYFEIDEGEVGQLCVCFLPKSIEFYAEKLFIICDNYSHQEIELLGDGIAFSDSFLRVDLYIAEDQFAYTDHMVQVTLEPFATASFAFSVINESPIYFEHFWALKTNTQDVTTAEKMDSSWIEILHSGKYLPSFSTTEVVVKITPRTELEGSYYIYFSLYLKNVPIKSVMSDHFRVRREGEIISLETCNVLCRPLEETKSEMFDMSNKLADVHIFELGLTCEVKIRTVIPTNVLVIGSLDPETFPQMTFTKIVLNFGLVPKGYQTSKHLYIKNLTDRELHWKIAEIRGEKDNFLISSGSNALNRTTGSLRRHEKGKITYTLQAKECVQRVDILCLFAAPLCACQDYIMESICLVAYEVAEINISIYTENNKAILCPREFIYVGIPSVYTVYVSNNGLVIGCFYFLKPVGTHADKVQLKFSPQSGVIHPGATVEVKVQLVALESGIVENVQIPCFIGDRNKFIFLTLLCTVANINLYFYLPNRDKGYNRFLWPPKTDLPPWDYETYNGEDIKEPMSITEGWLPPLDVPLIDPSLADIIATDSVAVTYPTVKTKEINVKQKAKVTFYMENLTPIGGHYKVNPTNYNPESECLNHILVKAKTRTPEFFWEKACMDGYGIVVEPERPSGDIVPYEVVEIHLWVYANTWGKYLEEVIVEVNDLTPFCFNLLLEVVGLPIEFPFARNTTLPGPTIRFENLAYMSEKCVRGFTVTNTSAVAVEIDWHVFTRAHDKHMLPVNLFVEFPNESLCVDMSRGFYGFEACSRCVSVKPWFLVVEKQGTVEVSVEIASDGFVPQFDKTRLKYELHGLIGLQNCDKFKENYFKRDCGMDAPHARISILVTLELPIMQMALSSDETCIDLFVNDILLCGYKFPEMYLLLRNVDKSVIHFKIGIEKPFLISGARTVPAGITNTENLTLMRNESLQVAVTCSFSYEDLTQYADLIYQHDDSEGIDKAQNFVSVISKSLNVSQRGAPRQAIPFTVRLHYPHIVVKPNFIKFGFCLLYRTKKLIFTIYNMTGAPIHYEIVKTTNHDDFEVRPSFGEIPRNTGVNQQFIDIAVYFTPRHCKLYLESLRILTNLPQYYIDVPVSGHGSIDEKFNV